MEIKVSNVNQALATALRRLQLEHVVAPSRNGEVWAFPEPVTTTYLRPLQRVLFSPLRDANPFFHVMEALWMLAGRNDVAWPAYFAKNMSNYSDNGKTLHGAYGYRWRKGFSVDQLDVLAELLARDGTTRRAVLGMWAPEVDLVYGTYPENRDAPCNTHAYFDVADDALNLTVCCRSNDLWWGCYGANAVHFSFLLEFMAAYAGYEVGVYRQFSNNLHLYTSIVPPETIDELAADVEASDEYLNQDWSHLPLVATHATAWQDELRHFLRNPFDTDLGDKEPFFKQVAVPLYHAWWLRKEDNQAPPLEITLAAADWELAANNWLARHARKPL
jgi:Thymidylate synthase